MERTKSEVTTGKVRYKKIGGGSLRISINGRAVIIKQNEVFSAFPSEIPKAFKDTVIPLDPVFEEKVIQTEKPKPVNITFTMQPRGKSKSLFDVIDGMGKVLNDKPLTKAVAESLINDLAK
jgi:hypothetical protein